MVKKSVKTRKKKGKSGFPSPHGNHCVYHCVYYKIKMVFVFFSGSNRRRRSAVPRLIRKM